MLIDCPRCSSRVKAIVRGAALHQEYEGDLGTRVSVGSCPSCGGALAGVADVVRHHDGSEADGIARRVWPDPQRLFSWEVPELVRGSLDEAERCLSAGAYSACAVMAGRAVEGICIEKGAKAKNLHHGLKELLDSGAIDERLFEWGNELRALRNVGAHATTEKVGREDAIDVRDFAVAICEYVFILTQRFEDFKRRRKASEMKATSGEVA